MTKIQLFENLHPWYRPLFKQIQREQIYAGENVFYAADFTGNDNTSFAHWGFMIFTDHRYLEVFASNDIIGLSYYKSGSGWDKLMGKQIENRKWIEPATSFKESYLQHLKLPELWDFEYSSIKGIIKNYHTVYHKEHPIQLTELRFDFRTRYGNYYKVFRKKDGEFIYVLINSAVQNGGKIPLETVSSVETSSNSSDIELINALVKLRKAGVLTDEEFEQKKQELLARL